MLEENYETSGEHQMRLNPNMRDVVKKDVLILLEARVISDRTNTEAVSL